VRLEHVALFSYYTGCLYVYQKDASANHVYMNYLKAIGLRLKAAVFLPLNTLNLSLVKYISGPRNH